MKKNFNVVGFILFILGVGVIVVSTIFSTQLFSEQSFFNNNPTGNGTIDMLFHKIPAVIRTIEIITVAFILNWIIKILFSKLFSRNKRGMTIIKLVTSFIKYLIAIVAILLILSAFGVNTGTLLASAGILGLVIGLGAQSLIADIIAGLFIVFEGEFRVGDIVTIGGFRGTVMDIGLRTTKIMGVDGNIKIFNNSDITFLLIKIC